MIEYNTEMRSVHTPAKIICDICKREALKDDLEYQEYISIRKVCGYGSVFGDGTVIEIDICEHCFEEKFGHNIYKLEDSYA